MKEQCEECGAIIDPEIHGNVCDNCAEILEQGGRL